jgi:hypothetical protein
MALRGTLYSTFNKAYEDNGLSEKDFSEKEKD